MKDLYTKTIAVQAIAAQAASSTVTGSAVDLDGCNAAIVTYNVGTPGETLDSSTTITIGLKECATSGGSYTDVASSDCLAPSSLAVTSGGVMSIGYIGSKRYIQPIVTFGGTHSATTCVAAEVLKGDLLLAK